MSSTGTTTFPPADREGSKPVYLTPEEIQAQIPPEAHTTLNPRRMKITQKDMDRIVELIREYTDPNTTEIWESNPDMRNQQDK